MRNVNEYSIALMKILKNKKEVLKRPSKVPKYLLKEFWEKFFCCLISITGSDLYYLDEMLKQLKQLNIQQLFSVTVLQFVDLPQGQALMGSFGLKQKEITAMMTHEKHTGDLQIQMKSGRYQFCL